MHGVIRTGGPLGKQLGWGGGRGDLDVVSPAIARRLRAERQRAEDERRWREEQERREIEAQERAARIRQLFGDAAPVPRQPMDAMIDVACDVFGIPRNEVIAHRRKRRICACRHTAMWLCCRFTTASLPQIGAKIGGRDHTTIMHARDKLNALIEAHGLDGGDNPSKWARLLAEVTA